MKKPLSQLLADFPQARLRSGVTPVRLLKNLTRHLGGPEIYIKRDDFTEILFGGNKIRQLEFYLGEANRQGADCVLITGAVQSNFVRAAASSAAILGMDCHIQLEERVPGVDNVHRTSGNVLLDRLLGATLYSYPKGEDEAGADKRLHEIADALKEQGRKPYIIPLAPGHPPLGALGYVAAAEELLGQDCGRFDEIVVASGSGATHGGLLTGLRLSGDKTPVLGVCVRRDEQQQSPRILSRAKEICHLLDVPCPVNDQDISITDQTLAPGYGQMNDACFDAIQLCARLEGIFLDPVYTAKVMAALTHRVTSGVYKNTERILFIHTGGQAALFGYQPELGRRLDREDPA